MKTKDWLAFLILTLAWGTSFFWIKIALEEISPFSLVVFRILFGILGLLVVVIIRKPGWPKERRQWIILVITGLINVAIPFMLISWGELHIDSGLASVLNGSVPLFTVVIAHFFLLDDKMTISKGIGVLVGFLGVIVLVSRDIQDGMQSNLLGQGAILLAALFYAGSSVFIRRFAKGIDTIIQSFIQLMAAEFILMAFFPFIGTGFSIPKIPLTWFAVIWLGIIGSCIAYLAYFYLLHSVGPSRATMVTFTFPVVGVLLGVLFLEEQMHWNLMLGILLVVISILIVNRKEKSKTVL